MSSHAKNKVILSKEQNETSAGGVEVALLKQQHSANNHIRTMCKVASNESSRRIVKFFKTF